LRLCAPVALIVGVLAWLQPQWSAHSDHDLTARIAAEVHNQLKEDHFTDRISTLEKGLSGLETAVQDLKGNIDLLLKKELRIAASLPPRQFDLNLDTVASYVEAASAHHIPLEPDLVRALASKISSSPETVPSYWSAAAAVATYRANRPEESSLRTLPPCLGNVASMAAMSIEMNFDCSISLDGTEYSDMIISKVIVLYRGGPIHARNVQFRDCIFVLDLPVLPSPAGRQLVRSLLATGGKQVVLNPTSPA
jgi:hypothetical protein